MKMRVFGYFAGAPLFEDDCIKFKPPISPPSFVYKKFIFCSYFGDKIIVMHHPRTLLKTVFYKEKYECLRTIRTIRNMSLSKSK